MLTREKNKIIIVQGKQIDKIRENKVDRTKQS